MGYGSDILDGRNAATRGLHRPQGRFTPGAGPLDIYMHASQTMLHGFAYCIRCRQLRCKGSAFPGALEALEPRT